MKALIVEDEIALQSLYGRVLESSGYEVMYADDGAFAIQLLEQGAMPQLIMLDIRMPNMNGLEVLEYLKGYPNIEQIHVVIATASRQFECYTEMLPSIEFLLKPVLPSHIQAIAIAMRHN